MADYSPNPANAAQMGDLLLRQQQGAIDLGVAQQNDTLKQQQILEGYRKAQYAPVDLYNQYLQNAIKTAKDLKPFEGGYMQQLGGEIANPAATFAKDANARTQTMDTARQGIPQAQAPQDQQPRFNPMDPASIDKEKALINSALHKGGKIQTAPAQRGPQSMVMPGQPTGLTNLDQQNQTMNTQVQQPVGPQDMMRAPAQAAPTGINFNDPMALPKLAARTDMGSVLSSDFDKVFPPFAQGLSMASRMIPPAAASMANNASTDYQKELQNNRDLEEKYYQADTLQKQNRILDDIKASTMRLTSMVNADKIGTGGGRGSGKAAADTSQEKAAKRDQDNIAEIEAKYKEAKSTMMPKDMKDANEASLTFYQNAETDVGKRHIWNLHSGYLQNNGMAPPAAASGFRPQRPGANTLINGSPMSPSNNGTVPKATPPQGMSADQFKAWKQDNP